MWNEICWKILDNTFNDSATTSKPTGTFILRFGLWNCSLYIDSRLHMRWIQMDKLSASRIKCLARRRKESLRRQRLLRDCENIEKKCLWKSSCTILYIRLGACRGRLPKKVEYTIVSCKMNSLWTMLELNVLYHFLPVA